MRSGLLPALLGAAAVAAGAAPASAVSSTCTAGAVTICFGQDFTLDPGLAMVPATFPNSSAAETEFQMLIGMGNYDTEGFEAPAFQDGDHGPLNIFQGGLSLSAVLTDSVADGGTVRAAPLDDAVNRGFPTEMNQFWKNETTSDASDELFNVAFSEGVRSFGFYATAWGTQSTLGATALVLDLHLSGGGVIPVMIPHELTGNLAGSVFYVGVISDLPFVAAALRNSTDINGGDRIGFDDFTVAIVPEPSTALLLGAGLLGLAATRRRAARTA